MALSNFNQLKIKLEEFNNEEINNDIFEMNDVLSENFTAFLIVLEGQEGMIIDSNKDIKLFYQYENISFLWTNKAMKLINEEQKRLIEIGRKYFGDNDKLEVESTMYREL